MSHLSFRSPPSVAGKIRAEDRSLDSAGMPRAVVSLLALALAGGAAIVLASCGEEDAQLLPGETAREITANLDTVQQLADEGDCVGAESAALQVSEQVEALDEVDARLQRALREGTARLSEVVAGCEEETEAFVPDTTTTEAEPPEEVERDKEKKKEDGDEDGEFEGDGDDEGEEEAPEEEAEPSLPPQAEGEGKGQGNGKGPPSGEEEAPSGGVSPSNPVDGDD
jgi:hypothetical protein